MAEVNTVEEYLAQLPADRRVAVSTVRDVVNAHLPVGYEETLAFGMVLWVVPLTAYPNTYNGKPLSIAALASQKRHMAVYLSGLYGSEHDETWFRDQYARRDVRLDMGKSCVRFRTLDELPLDVLAEAIGRVSPARLIARHETAQAGSGRLT